MVNPEPPLLRPPNVEPAQGSNEGCFWLAAGVVAIGVLVVIGRYSGGPTGNSSVEAMNSANAEMSNSIAAQGPPPIEALSAASVSRGGAHFRLAFAAESFPGAMVYSQNCYDALGRAFTWSKLDQCGGFDMLAVRAIDSAEITPAGERDYFESEAAAGRYLAAATSAGEAAGDADQRLSQLQARTGRERAPVLRLPAAENLTEANAFTPRPPYVDADGNPLDDDGNE